MAPGFLGRLFGGAKPKESLSQGEPNEAKAVEHEGFRIVPAPIRQPAGWLTAGIITKEVDGVLKEHRFIRADVLGDQGAAEDHAIFKARRTIDELGETIFPDREPPTDTGSQEP